MCWALLVIVLLVASTGPAHGCTTIGVGKGATDDGSSYSARTVDFKFSNWTAVLRYQPARDTPLRWTANLNAFAVDLPAPGLWYISAPDFDQAGRTDGLFGFEEVGVNAAGVVVSATESIHSNNATLEADPFNEESGITEEVIPSIILPQAISARHAAQLLGSYIEAHGSGESYGCLFSDADESWYLESAGGHLWLAQRIPDDAVFVSANQGRLQEVDFEDTQSVLHSPGLQEFAVRSGLWDPSKGPFNWLAAFMADSKKDETYNYPRVAWLQSMYVRPTSPSQGPFFPVFQKPARPLGLADVMDGLRQHYKGNENDPYAEGSPAENWRPTAVLRTSLGHVTRVRPASEGLPDPLAVINYVAMSMPLLSPFIPIYKGLPAAALPPALTSGNGTAPDGVSLSWKQRRLQALVFQDLPALLGPAAEAIKEWELDVEAQQRPVFEARFTRLWEAEKQEAAVQELAAFTDDLVAQVSRLLDELAVQASAALGFNGLPPDAELLPLLWNATATYLFRGA